MKSQIKNRFTSLGLIFLLGLLFSACSSPSTAQDAQYTGERSPQREETANEKKARELSEWRERKTRH